MAACSVLIEPLSYWFPQRNQIIPSTKVIRFRKEEDNRIPQMFTNEKDYIQSRGVIIQCSVFVTLFPFLTLYNGKDLLWTVYRFNNVFFNAVSASEQTVYNGSVVNRLQCVKQRTAWSPEWRPDRRRMHLSAHSPSEMFRLVPGNEQMEDEIVLSAAPLIGFSILILPS